MREIHYDERRRKYVWRDKQPMHHHHPPPTPYWMRAAFHLAFGLLCAAILAGFFGFLD